MTDLTQDYTVGRKTPPTDEQIAFWESVKSVVSPITEEIYVSGFPDTKVIEQIRELGIGAVISCTRTDPPALPVSNVIRVPFDDDLSVMPHEAYLIYGTNAAMDMIGKGHKVLVHCAYGLNRSALLVGHILGRRYPDLTGTQIFDIIKANREGSLHNELFAEAVRSINQRA